MNQARFDIQFTGELLPGTDPAGTRQHIQTLFRLSDAAIAQLFSGQPVTIKRGIDSATVARYQERFLEAGALLQIIPAAPGEALSLSWEAGAEATGTPSLPRLYGSDRPDHLEIAVSKAFHYFEKTLSGILLLLVSVVAVIAVVELCLLLYKDLLNFKSFLVNQEELFEVFGMFLMVLIAVELMASIYMYMIDKSVHAEMMLLIAITALTRKVVVMDTTAKEPLYLIGMAALLGVLIGGYYLIRRQRGDKSLGPGH